MLGLGVHFIFCETLSGGGKVNYLSMIKLILPRRNRYAVSGLSFIKNSTGLFCKIFYIPSWGYEANSPALNFTSDFLTSIKQ